MEQLGGEVGPDGAQAASGGRTGWDTSGDEQLETSEGGQTVPVVKSLQPIRDGGRRCSTSADPSL